MKKTVKQISIILGLCLLFVSIFSCKDIVGLGEKLDINGPVITITAPPARKPFRALFTLEGTASDFTGIDTLLVKAIVNNQETARQWRYYNGVWQITEDRGVNWTFYTSNNTVWQGDARNAVWKVDIDFQSISGEYTIVVQAWDVGGFSDENSYKSRVIIVDNDLPSIDITDPYLYYEYSTPDKKPIDADFTTLAGYGDENKARFDPANIGKFITRGFNLQYQINDEHDIYSIEIRLYDDTTIIDGDISTPLPDGYIFTYKDNDGPPPELTVPGGTIRPNGKIAIPALDGTDPSIKKQIITKTTIMIVGLCYDAAGNVNEEKILGYFFYWSKADKPWVTFAEGLLPPSGGSNDIHNSGYTSKAQVYMIYPGREIKSIAYQAHGLTKVEYSLYKWSDWNSERDATPMRQKLTVLNDPRFGDTHSTIFPWSFLPPTSTGFYSVVVNAYGEEKTAGAGEVVSDTFEYMFFVQDASFPDFPEEPSPSASLPLYQSIGKTDNFGNITGANKIRIHGTVSDATAIDSVYLVWINPDSLQYAAMSQLSYFRDSEYNGWKVADGVSLGNFNEEAFYEEAQGVSTLHKNKVWNVPIKSKEDATTDRKVYEYSQLIDITDHLNIAGTTVGKDRPLRSQTFLLRARNPDGKCTIITYAPQGDESSPIITKKAHPNYLNDRNKDYQIKVTISGSQSKTCYSGHYELVEQFAVGDKITVEGEWKEDSIGFLNFENYLKNNIEITINGYKIDGSGNTTLTYTPPSGSGFTEGTWKAEATLGAKNTSSHKLWADNIKDTLVVSITIKDIGGNITEAGGSWLIRSDTLRLLRISSEMADTKYNASPTPILIFLEFNKPVQLTNPSAVPELQLNVTGGTTASRTAKYATYVPKTSTFQTSTQSTKQYFEYTVTSGHGTSDPVLDVTGLVGGGTGTALPSSYVYSWYTGSGTDREDIKITTPTNAHATGTDRDTSGAYLRRLPIYSNTTPVDDRVYSLRGNKSIEIDTTPPTVTKIESTNPAGFYAKDADIFIEVTFNENVTIGASPPALQLQLRTSATATRTVDTSGGTVKVNGNKISFTYKVLNGDTTWGYPIVVTGFTPANSIMDIAGNVLTTIGSSVNLNGTTDATIRGIEANIPEVPVVKIKTAAANAYGDTTNNIASNNVDNAAQDVKGVSTGTGTSNAADTSVVALSTLYNDDLWFAIDGNTSKGAHTLNALEYSINNGTDWVRVSGTSITNNFYVYKLPRSGEYKIISRQIDKAGNVSNWSQPITLTWDPGTLVTNITSTSANGTYTHNGDRKTINIRVNFRKPLAFASAPELVINAKTANLTADTSQFTGARTYLDYTYTVASGDTTGTNNLDVTGFYGTFKAKDGANSTTGVEVSSYIKLPTASNALLKNNKAIIVDTSPLNITNGPLFTGGSVQADGSWTGRMEITFNNNVAKGTGNIKIEQVPGTDAATRYRLPAVLTEAQYNKLRNASNINTFYTKGTNGYIANGNTGESDTSTKYILRYDLDTANITPNSSGTDIEKLAEAVRLAEAVEVNINAQAVTISGKTLTVQLTGSNALQVAGASYAVTYPAGLVQDSLDNSLAARTSTTGIATTGIARPYIRIQRSQDIITSQTGSATVATYTATQPLTSAARMDCRTPGASVVYSYLETRTNISALNWTQNNGPDDSLTTGNPNPSNLTDPAATTGTAYSTPITLPITNGDRTTYQGYQCLIRAKGRTGTTGNYTYSAASSDEIAYRTVLTYQIRAMANDGDWTQTMITRGGTGGATTNGAQVWIRGGDAIGSSTTPGFPLTWGDDWFALSGKRAGIRLMTATTNTNLDTASTWKFVSWEINVPAYVDMIKGYSTTTDSAELIWQYGPREFAYQRAGWTSFKEQYPLYPGKHRWLYVDGNDSFANKGRVNFSNTYSIRRIVSANEGWTNPNTANAAP